MGIVEKETLSSTDAAKKNKLQLAEYSRKLCPKYAGFSVLMIASSILIRVNRKQHELSHSNI
jgi:hypothetical protein